MQKKCSFYTLILVFQNEVLIYFLFALNYFWHNYYSVKSEFKNQFMNKLFRLSIISILTFELFSCKIDKTLPLSAVINVKAVPGVVSNLELKNSFKIDAMLTKNSGNVRKTAGLDGFLSWKNFNVTVKNGSFKNGEVFFDRNVMQGDSVKIVLKSIDNPNLKDSISVRIPKIVKIDFIKNGNTISYNQVPKLNCNFEFSSGKQISSNLAPLLLNELSFYSQQIEYYNNEFNWRSLTQDSIFKSIYVVATLNSNPNIKTNIEQEISYNESFTFMANGTNGSNGSKGNEGDYGDARRVNGADGQYGQNGQNGEDGENINVEIKAYFLEKDTIWRVVYESSKNRYKQFKLLNVSKGAKFVIYANGGNGGNGGSGGKGGPGYDGTATSEPGYGGNGGTGGGAGYGGLGGNITVKSDVIAKKFSANLIYSNEGGNAGAPGSGGRSGRGGVKYNSNSWNRLFTGRSGNSGYDGQTGKAGYKGRFEWNF